MAEIQTYNQGHLDQKDTAMPRTKAPTEDKENFGKRLLQFRKAAGYSQYTLAHEMGISQRMILHYENARGNPPLHLFPKFAKALGVTTDQLFGLEKAKAEMKDNRLRRRIGEIERLPLSQRKEVARYLETFLMAWKNELGKG
jgi:transcriptional regulator with XRE-family HTH domain